MSFFLERVRGIEPPCSAWEADILPLNYTRKFFYIIAGFGGKSKHFFRRCVKNMELQIFHKSLFTNPVFIAIIHNKKVRR